MTNFENTSRRIGFLLGAGASRKAGIPTAYPLTNELFNKVKERSPQLVNHFSAVIGGIKFSKSLSGHGPNDELNVEEVVSAVQLIANRRTLEIAPFVEGWLPIIEQLDRSENLTRHHLANAFSSFGQDIENYVSKSLERSMQSVERALQEAVSRDRHRSSFPSRISVPSMNFFTLGKSREITRIICDAVFRPSGVNFKGLYETMHAVLIDIMWLTEPNLVDYLSPISQIANSSSIPIFTLNYDNTIELFAQQSGTPIFDGFDSGGRFTNQWSNEERGINLFKLHGSVTWITNDRNELIKMERKEFDGIYVPTLVFGQREKLRSEGPFLDLLFEFKRRLPDIDDLIVIGYSFGDLHINKFIRQWLSGGTKRITIVNGSSYGEDLEPLGGAKVDQQVKNTKMSCEDFLPTLVD